MSNIRCTNNEYVRLFILLCIISALGVITVHPNHSVSASADAVKWTRVNIPNQGEAGNWVLADGSDVQLLTSASDGTLYAYGRGLTYTLYRSADNGISWKHIGNVQNAITDIAVSPYDSGTIYYATVSNLYRSIDGGKTFSLISANPGGAGTGNIEITSIDVAWLNGNVIAIGTRDTDNAEFGGVFTLDETTFNWIDTGIGNYDVYSVSFSPDYSFYRALVAVMTDEVDTFVAHKVGDSGWGAIIGHARLDRDNSGIPTPVAVAESASVAFPDNYNADPSSGYNYCFIAIDTGTDGGDIYKIRGAYLPQNSISTDLNIGYVYGLNNVDISSLSILGKDASVTLLAGAANTPWTYLSSDTGLNWTRSLKSPTGQSDTCVLLSPDFITSGLMYAATTGTGSAFSISRDGGVTWNQISMIDTTVTTVLDLAPSPNYDLDNTLFMITFGGGHHLWRTIDGGGTWERIISSSMDTVDSLNMIGLPPRYGTDCPAVFLTGVSGGSPAVWKSDDNGQSFRRRFTRDPATGAPFTIDTWAIADEMTLFLGSYDGASGIIYQTANSGFSYSPGVTAGNQPLNCIVLSPQYAQDGTILTGNTNGWVYWSQDSGTSFQPLPGGSAAPPLSGAVTLAFDPAYNSNHTVFAASDTADAGAYRLITGTFDDWEDMGGTLPAGTSLNRIGLADGSTLYAANSVADGGMVRSLNPTFALGPTLETVTRGLSDGATLFGLWLNGNRLWSVDTTNFRLMTYNDTLKLPVVQVSPENAAAVTGSLIDHTVRDITLDWEALDGASVYQWQCDSDTDLSAVPAGLDANTSASSARLPALEPSTTYYWRVRASAPVLSPWTEKWSFTTGLDTETIHITPESPAAGASGVPPKPVFQWTAVADATAYELLVSDEVDFKQPSIVKVDEYALPTTAWQCDVSLEYDTTYYWKVRAINASTRSDWSTTGAFTTQSPPEVVGEPPDETTPPVPSEPADALSMQTTQNYTPLPTVTAPSPVQPPAPLQTTDWLPAFDQSYSIPGWLPYLVGALILIIILALIIILTFVLKIRHI